jgi:SAM-dependent methyltransferase
MSPSKKGEWSEYYANHQNHKPTHTLLKGIKCFNDRKLSLRKKSIDIGCGQGTDTAELLRQGWDVIAVDRESEAEEIIIDRHSKFHGKELTIIVQEMENIIIPKVSLVNASFSLPFCNPNKFSNLWEEITTKLSIGGIFCGQLFGLEDSWASNKNMTFHHRKSLDALFKKFRIHFLHEENSVSKTSSGEEKNWHLFDLIAVKQK